MGLAAPTPREKLQQRPAAHAAQVSAVGGTALLRVPPLERTKPAGGSERLARISRHKRRRLLLGSGPADKKHLTVHGEFHSYSIYFPFYFSRFLSLSLSF